MSGIVRMCDGGFTPGFSAGAEEEEIYMKTAALLMVAGLATAANAQISIVPSNVSFVDISGTGTSIGAISDDSETTIAGGTIGWGGNGLLAGGMALRIGNNGAIVWGTSAGDTFSTSCEVGYYNPGPNNTNSPAGSMLSILTMSPFNTGSNGNGNGTHQLIAPLWDDYVPVSGGTTSSIRWQVIGNDLIVQWNRMDAFAATGSGDVTFEAIFHGGVALGSGASLVDFVYQDTVFQANQYQNDGGSASIGFANNGVTAGANSVEYGPGGGGASSTSDPAFGGLGMSPRVGGWVTAGDPTLTHSLSIVPTPGAAALLGLGGLMAGRRRRA
jgi:MYXO-CTERM domain-containing protein